MHRLEFDRRKSGVPLIRDLPWGSHFCQFYQDWDDLLEILVPYFTAGIEGNELCLWTLAGETSIKEAERELRKAAPRFSDHLKGGRIRILRAGLRSAGEPGAGEDIVKSLDAAILEGFDGLRLALPLLPRDKMAKPGQYPSFIDSMRTLNVIALFLYQRRQIDAPGLINLVKDHRYALLRDSGGWKVLEGSQARTIGDDLERSQEKLRALFGNMSEGFAFHRIILDSTGAPCDYVFLEINQAFVRLTGLDPEKIIGRRVTQVIPGIGDDPADWIGRYGHVALTMEPMQFESYLVGLDRWYAVSAFSSHKGFFATTFSDITARKRAEAERRAIEEHLRITLTSIGDAVVSTDAEGRITFLNPVASALTGWLEGEAMGRPAFEVFRTIHEHTRESGEDIVSRVLRENRTVLLSNDISLLSRDGREIPIEDSAAPIRAADGRVSGVVLIFHDVSAKRLAREALQRAKDELERRVEERTRELGDANMQLRALASDLTLTEQRERRRIAKLLHDHLQQLLVASKFGVSHLHRSVDAGARSTGEKINALLDQAIQASRTLTAEISPPILYERGLASALRWLADWTHEKYGLTVDLSDRGVPPGLPEDVCVLLFESVREAIFNIVKHAGVTQADVDVQCEADRLLITVSDRGMGFDSKFIPPPVPGGGFGLFGIRERLNLLGGHLIIDSVPAKGTRVILSAPVAGGTPSGRGRAADEERAEAASAPKRGDAIRVLVVDDHAVTREGLCHVLGQDAGLEVVGVAADGEEAIELTRRLRPHVVLMDVNMAPVGGVEATRIIRKSMPGVKIVGLSMFDEPETAAEMLAAGACAFLSKSGSASRIVHAVRSCGKSTVCS